MKPKMDVYEVADQQRQAMLACPRGKGVEVIYCGLPTCPVHGVGMSRKPGFADVDSRFFSDPDSDSTAARRIKQRARKSLLPPAITTERADKLKLTSDELIAAGYAWTGSTWSLILGSATGRITRRIPATTVEDLEAETDNKFKIEFPLVKLLPKRPEPKAPALEPAAPAKRAKPLRNDEEV